MKIFELFSGFIAAIVIALGAGLYVNQDTSVGEELVVEHAIVEEVGNRLAEIKANCVWYEYVGTNLSDPGYEDEVEMAQHYLLFSSNNPTGSPDCELGQQVCAVCLPPTSENTPHQDDLDFIQDEIRDGEPVTGLLKLKPEPIH